MELTDNRLLPTVYDQTDLFWSYLLYHNDNCMVSYDEFTVATPTAPGGQRNLRRQTRNLSRFDTFRRIEGARLGSRPFAADTQVAQHKPNQSFGYLSWFFDYLVLPYKSVFTDGDIAKIQLNRTLYNRLHLDDREQEEFRLAAANNPVMLSNKEVSDDISDAFNMILRLSNKVKECTDVMPLAVVRDGFAAQVYSDLDWKPTHVNALDLVTEPQCEWNPEKWSSFYVIKKIPASEIMDILKNGSDTFWNKDALRWALEDSYQGQGLLNSRHYSYSRYIDDRAQNENFTVKSFYADKQFRLASSGSYYGHILLVEAYMLNESGGIDKAIFFPSATCQGIDGETRKELDKEELSPDFLFYRKNVFPNFHKAISIIPFNRAERTLERQRGYGHELFSTCEALMRVDSSILNHTQLIGSPFVRNRQQGINAQEIDDLEIKLSGDVQDIGDREFVTLPFTVDLNAMMGVRGMLLQHAAAKSFLGGLDGMEMSGNGRGAQLVNFRLIRDARVHKHNIEMFGEGLRAFLTIIFRGVLDQVQNEDSADLLIKRLFYDQITKVQGHSPELLEFEDKDVIEDTMLPYWMNIDAVCNGSSHFGGAELVLYTELQNAFGGILDQRGSYNLARGAIKSMLGSADAIDILGDPADVAMTSQDQIYRATTETAAILGSVEAGALSFEAIPILPDKDDHMLHLAQVHNPKMTEIIERLKENDVTPEVLAEMMDTEIETRNALILRLGALANHAALHLEQLERFGSKREDVNRLKEETNYLMQAAEGYMNSLTLNLRVLQTKQQEQAIRLQSLAPENVAEREKNELELLKIQTKNKEIEGKLILANKIAADRQRQHMDKQISKARDRELKKYQADQQAILKQEEINMTRRINNQEKENSNATSSRSDN